MAAKFQFYDSAIKRGKKVVVMYQIIEFQFYDSAIKSVGRNT